MIVNDEYKMKILRVYIDTSVIGGCFEDQFKAWSNGIFEDFKAGRFKPVLSNLSFLEIEAGAPENVKEKYRELLDFQPEILEMNDEMRRLANKYIERKVLSEKFKDDALHIAAASVAAVDVLVSWNFKHIVHYEKIRQFSGINLELGYQPIQIYSPMEVTAYGGEI